MSTVSSFGRIRTPRVPQEVADDPARKKRKVEKESTTNLSKSLLEAPTHNNKPSLSSSSSSQTTTSRPPLAPKLNSTPQHTTEVVQHRTKEAVAQTPRNTSQGLVGHTRESKSTAQLRPMPTISRCFKWTPQNMINKVMSLWREI